MSKRSSKAAPAPRRSKTRKGTRSTAAAPRVSRRARAARQVGMNARAVRIAAEVVAAAALLGGLVLAASAQGSYSAGVIVGLVALGLLAGLGLVTALRPDAVIRRVNRLARR